ncbi:MAG: GH1 family beta-glucosidase [Pseudomonadota bacterium]
MLPTRSAFPDDFVFGAATSSYQIEGHGFGGAGRTHWDDFAATPGNVVRGEDCARACEHYHHLEEDLDLLAGLNVDVYRFSTSWARVLPEGRGTVNEVGLDFYDRLVDGLLERGIKPALTLYHWELPSALADLGGWRNRDISGWFSDYTQLIAARLGDRLWSVAPINEPWCVGWLSHFVGAHAPGLRDIRATARAMHHILLCHGTAIQVMRAAGLKNLGAVCNLEWATRLDDSASSARAAARYDAIYNRFFLGGLFKGAYPDLVLEGLAPHLPAGWRDDFKTIMAPVDWCGVNYYTRTLVYETDGVWPHYGQTTGALPKNTIGWETYPQGLFDFLIRLRREYTGDLPLVVTENGMATDDVITSGAIDDTDRIAFIDVHLREVLRALEAGVPVKGYYLLSLLDNYEWTYGYDKRFGAVHVDFESLQRTPKASYHALTEAFRRHAHG